MNKYFLFLAMMVLAGCTDHQIVGEVAKEELPTSESYEIDALMEQARRGDGDESGISGDEEGDQNELNLTARPSLQRPLHRHLL